MDKNSKCKDFKELKLLECDNYTIYNSSVETRFYFHTALGENNRFT